MCLFEAYKPISGWHENAVYLWAFFLSRGKSSGRRLRLSFDWEVKLILGGFDNLNQLSDVLTGIWAVLWLHPGVVESIGVAAKWSELDSLFLLLASIIRVDVRSTFETRMEGIINIDIRSWSWVWSFDFLVDMADVAWIECRMDSFFINDFILEIVLFLFMVILTWTWVFKVSLFCVRCFSFITPELTSLCFCQETLCLLLYKLPVWVWLLMSNYLIFNREGGFVSTWAWLSILVLLVFAVWHFRLENSVLAAWIELLLPKFFIVIYSRAWVHFLCFSWDKCFPSNLIWNEIILSRMVLDGVSIWVVGSRSDHVLAHSWVCRLGQFLGWDAWWLCLGNNS